MYTLSYIVLALLAVGITGFLMRKKILRRYFLKSLQLRIISVALPQRQAAKETADPLKEINITAQLLGALSNFNMPFALEMAVHAIDEEIHFYVGVPAEMAESGTSRIQGLWNDAIANVVEDYHIFK